MNYRKAEFSDLVGKMIKGVTGLYVGSEEVSIACSDGSKYRMYHYQDCCETVQVEDVAGDIEDLVGALVIEAREESNGDNPPREYAESWTWTFYIIQTNKGAVTIRWLGESNGYYGEKAYFEKIDATA